MIVTARATNGQSKANRPHRGRGLDEFVLPAHFGIDVPGHHFPGTAPRKTRSDERLAITRGDFIPRNLQSKEAVVGHVLVERVNHPIPIPPGIRTIRVQLEPVGIGVVRQVQPVLRPAFAISRRGQEPIYSFVPRLRG